jgi:signal transduction histidine kinase
MMVQRFRRVRITPVAMHSILVIDDDAAVRQLVLRALSEVGYRVSVAENGLDGIAMAKELLPDLILCDVRMDKLDGYGTLARLRSNGATSTIPFILMTGDADHAGMRQGMELGADDYLPKPFTVTELEAAVKARLQKQLIIRQQVESRLASLRANISYALPHELRTPLNGILGFAEVMVQDYASLRPDDILIMAKAIRDSAGRLQRTIERTLLYAQLEMARGDEAKVRALRQGCVENLAVPVTKAARERALAGGRSDDLRLALAPLRTAIAEEHLRRITDELVDNAFKFSAPGTPVTVAAQATPDGILLSVTDAGRGMKPEHIASVGAYMQFERRLYEQQGSGLGLTIARLLAEIHGATLSIRSEADAGTVVTVSLPPAGVAPATPEVNHEPNTT